MQMLSSLPPCLVFGADFVGRDQNMCRGKRLVDQAVGVAAHIT
jgi:hypothetical protein